MRTGCLGTLFPLLVTTAPPSGRVRQWYKSKKQGAVELLGKYQMRHAAKYEYFLDKGTPVSDTPGILPLNEPDAETCLEKTRHIELKGAAFHYFLNVSDYRPAGEGQPNETARAQVEDILLNLKQAGFMGNVKNELYERAEKQNGIKYY